MRAETKGLISTALYAGVATGVGVACPALLAPALIGAAVKGFRTFARSGPASGLDQALAKQTIAKA